MLPLILHARQHLRMIGLALIALPMLTRAEDRWIRVTADQFTVLTPVDAAPAQAWARELAAFRRSLQAVVPVPDERVRPVTVMLFRDARAMEPFLPLENGRPARMGGLFVRTNDLNIIMLSLGRSKADTRHVIYHEVVHWHLGARDAVLPLWLSEGLAELYGTFEQTDAAHSQFGRSLPGHIALLKTGQFMPLANVLRTEQSSILYNESRRGNIFYAESWALAHLLVVGDPAAGPAAVQRYVDSLTAGLPGEASFVTAFGADVDEIEARLRRYIGRGEYRPLTMSSTEVEIPAPVGPASAAEVQLIQGALLAGSRGPELAEPLLRRATELAPEDARAWEQLAIAEAKRGASQANGKLLDQAAEHFRQAIVLSPRHVPNYEGLAGVVYSMSTSRTEDVAVLSRGLMLAPTNGTIAAGLGGAELRRGHTLDGTARLERIVASDHAEASLYARRILAREAFKAELAQVNALMIADRFAEAIAGLDRLLKGELKAADREIVLALRQTLAGLAKSAATTDSR